MPARVVDASVVAAIAFAEPRAQEALALLGTDDLYAPSLLALTRSAPSLRSEDSLKRRQQTCCT